MSTTVLKAENLKMHFPIYKGLVFRTLAHTVKAVDGVSLILKEGETLGLVGESGCGKSSLGRALIRLYKPTSGIVEICGTDISQMDHKELTKHRVNFQMIFQDPYASLNPRMTVFEIIAEPIKVHNLAKNKDDLDKQINDLMKKVGLSPRYIHKYPHEFSGGQRQRIAVARALAINPKVIICDEPVSALDVSIQAQILNLLKDLQKDLGLSYIFIAHDISAVKHISDAIAVMYLGQIVERAATKELLKNPKHPYTKALLSAIPVPDPKIERTRKRILIKGDLPSPMNPPQGCPFNTRCPLADQQCRESKPPSITINENHSVACFKVSASEIDHPL